jgi:prophage regulatory protein
MPNTNTRASSDAPDRQPGRLIRLQEVISRTCLSRTEIYRRIAAGTFPTNIRVGLRAVAWSESEIDDWIRSLVQQHRSATGARK